MRMVRDLDPSFAEAFGVQLATALARLRGGREPVDDETILVLQRTAADRQSPPLTTNPRRAR